MRTLPKQENAGCDQSARSGCPSWEHAGWPPGRYVEFWTSVEQVITVLRRSGAAAGRSNAGIGKYPVTPVRRVNIAIWGQSEWKQPIKAAAAEAPPVCDTE